LSQKAAKATNAGNRPAMQIGSKAVFGVGMLSGVVLVWGKDLRKIMSGEMYAVRFDFLLSPLISPVGFDFPPSSSVSWR
jgi:hypothetical protein